MAVDRTKIRWNGWGWTAHGSELQHHDALWGWLATELGMPALLATPARPLDEISLPPNRLTADDRAGLEEIVGADCIHDTAYERAFHALGRSYHDLLRLRAGDLSSAPDAVLYPHGTGEVLAVLSYAAEHGIAVVPYGGGTSVVGGVTAARRSFGAVITLDLSMMDRLIDIDTVSGTATVEAGIYGPAIERALQAKGYTLGHHPQSFEFSTLGGWVAHSGAGQGSNRYGRANEWLVSAKLATPRGLLTTGDFPASAAGPQLKNLVVGSEGVFGVITEATIKIRPLPKANEFRGYIFRDFDSGIAAVHAAVADGIPVTMLRLSDSEETRFFRAYGALGKIRGVPQRVADYALKLRGYAGKPCAMIAAFEGEARDVAAARRRFGTLVGRYGAMSLGTGIGERWRQTRFQGPYLRDPLLDHGVGVDTLETSASWTKIRTLYAATTGVLERAIRETVPREGARGVVMCHISHSYTDGASLYFTYVFPRALDAEIAQWKAIKTAATQTIVANGGTLSHHHGVGQDHLPWIAAEKGPLGIDVLRAVKTALDPVGILNPGKLLPE
jgi:alkyldihydroxyacetonephosphate synthase